MKSVETDIQMRFADFDTLGHVNNVNLQHYFDLGKSDFYRRVIGLGAYGPSGDTGVYPVTAATQTDYLAQTRPAERIYVETALEKVGNKSMTLAQRIVSRTTGEVKATSHSVMVAFDFARQESVPVPEEWRVGN
jgi:acyl-CoA thioesterase FadM